MTLDSRMASPVERRRPPKRGGNGQPPDSRIAKRRRGQYTSEKDSESDQEVNRDDEVDSDFERSTQV